VDDVGLVAGGSLFLLVLMFETPHSLHTHIRSSLYIYHAIQHLLQWLQVISALWDLRVDVVGGAGGSLVVLMFEAPHSLHTHIRSSFYIYNAI
jgi:hypothetical protein